MNEKEKTRGVTVVEKNGNERSFACRPDCRDCFGSAEVKVWDPKTQKTLRGVCPRARSVK